MDGTQHNILCQDGSDSVSDDDSEDIDTDANNEYYNDALRPNSRYFPKNTHDL